MLIQKNYNNSIAWQIDSQEKLMIEMDRNSDGVLSTILDMRKTYTKYLNQTNKVDD